MLRETKPIKNKNDLMTALRTAQIDDLLVIDRVDSSRVAASQVQKFLNERTDTTLILLRTKR